MLPPNHQQNPVHPVPTGGAYRDRHGRWARDAMAADGAEDEGAGRGRRSRVVLTPRRWREVDDNALHCVGDGDKNARSPEKMPCCKNAR